MYSSKWHYAKDIVNRQKVTGTTTGYNNYDFHETQDRSQVCVLNLKRRPYRSQCFVFSEKEKNGKPNLKIELIFEIFYFYIINNI